MRKYKISEEKIISFHEALWWIAFREPYGQRGSSILMSAAFKAAFENMAHVNVADTKHQEKDSSLNILNKIEAINQAKSILLAHLRKGDLISYGIPKSLKGSLEKMQPNYWAVLDIKNVNDEETSSVIMDVENWGRISFEQQDILKLWPDTNQSLMAKIRTSPGRPMGVGKIDDSKEIAMVHKLLKNKKAKSIRDAVLKVYNQDQETRKRISGTFDTFYARILKKIRA